MVDIRPVEFADCIPEIGELLRAHFEEMAFDFPLAISSDMYRALARSGVLIAFAAFDGESVVGYCTAMLSPHTFNPSVVFALHDLLFVSQSHRGAGVGRQLIEVVETEARKRGASRMLWHTHAGTPLADSMQKHGYKPVDVVVMKGL